MCSRLRLLPKELFFQLNGYLLYSGWGHLKGRKTKKERRAFRAIGRRWCPWAELKVTHGGYNVVLTVQEALEDDKSWSLRDRHIWLIEESVVVYPAPLRGREPQRGAFWRHGEHHQRYRVEMHSRNISFVATDRHDLEREYQKRMFA